MTMTNLFLEIFENFLTYFPITSCLSVDKSFIIRFAFIGFYLMPASTEINKKYLGENGAKNDYGLVYKLPISQLDQLQVFNPI